MCVRGGGPRYSYGSRRTLLLRRCRLVALRGTFIFLGEMKKGTDVAPLVVLQMRGAVLLTVSQLALRKAGRDVIVDVSHQPRIPARQSAEERLNVVLRGDIAAQRIDCTDSNTCAFEQ